jgi:hypothetical protein
MFDLPSVAQLKRIADTMDAHIVISSAWRLDSPDSPRRGALTACLRENGLLHRIIDKTGEDTGMLDASRFGSVFGRIRGRRIFKWLIENKEKYEVGSFVILDDISDMGILNPYLAVCEADEGITAGVSEKAICILHADIQNLFKGWDNIMQNSRAVTRQDIENAVMKALEDPAALYKNEIIKSNNEIEGIPYIEIAAEMIIKESAFSDQSGRFQFQMITREKSYKTPSHAVLAKREKPENSNRTEEWIAIAMYGKTFDGFGEIIDFQTPLKNIMEDSAGKIDLLSYNETQNAVYSLELKRPESPENLLRCVMEAYTYWRTVDSEKLLSDFGKSGCVLRKAVLVFDDSLAYRQFVDKNRYPNTHRLMKLLDVDLFLLK